MDENTQTTKNTTLDENNEGKGSKEKVTNTSGEEISAGQVNQIIEKLPEEERKIIEAGFHRQSFWKATNPFYLMLLNVFFQWLKRSSLTDIPLKIILHGMQSAKTE